MGELNINLSDQKLRGGYYTPKVLTDFITRWAIKDGTELILEPSCGDGNFIESAITHLKNMGITNIEISKRLKGVELIKEEAEKAMMRTHDLGIDSSLIINSDFFSFVKANNSTKYDVVIGNPPFIRYQNFPEAHRSIAMNSMFDLGFKPNRLTNIWVPFLVISASLLSKNGRLAMVVPAELFQVKYAEETRLFLAKYFSRISIVTFKKLVFKGIQQEIVILLCEKESTQNSGIRVWECEDLNQLHTFDFEQLNSTEIKPIDHTSEKWIKYFLTKDEIELLRELKSDKRIIPLGKLLEVDVGLVTGRNEFFMLKEEDVKKWNLGKHTIPVVSKSKQLSGLKFDNIDYANVSQDSKPVHLFMPPNEDFEKLPEECKSYIEYGEKSDFHTGYKCRIRKRWFITA